MKPLIGILGGMGPLATVDLMHKIIEETQAERDQDHVATVVWNNPQIPDRQQALAGSGPSPLLALLEGIAALNAAGATCIVIPCNTAHYWFEPLRAASRAPLIHIADATLQVVRHMLPEQGRIGLIATQGTLEMRLYQDRFDVCGIAYMTNTEEEVNTLFTPGCYAIKRGELHAGGILLADAAACLVNRGATTLVLACTEVPIGLAQVQPSLLAMSIDPNRALAQACVRYWQQAIQAGNCQ